MKNLILLIPLILFACGKKSPMESKQIFTPQRVEYIFSSFQNSMTISYYNHDLEYVYETITAGDCRGMEIKRKITYNLPDEDMFLFKISIENVDTVCPVLQKTVQAKQGIKNMGKLEKDQVDKIEIQFTLPL